ncbi:MAG: hypothetical protein U1D30_08680 [Planctomycetota bacterium]
MARRNRVTPSGEIIASEARGTLMGNRGRLHDEQGNIVRRWSSKCWIACRLEFKGRKRQIMAPDSYTELFFLDEATALAAGHRPCFECRRQDFYRFREAWRVGVAKSVEPPKADAMDKRLQGERTLDHSERPWVAMDDLPDGTFVLLEDAGAHMVYREHVHEWTPFGYSSRRQRGTGTARLLTPPSMVEVLRSGYEPALHASVFGEAM